MSGKRALIRGTAILTITSFVTRFMGFSIAFFGSYLWRRKCRPLSTCISCICPWHLFSCAGTELALSRCVAQENAAGHPEKAKELLKTGLIFTFVLSCILTIFYSTMHI